MRKSIDKHKKMADYDYMIQFGSVYEPAYSKRRGIGKYT